jgi:CheY-like chemotaxis protein
MPFKTLMLIDDDDDDREVFISVLEGIDQAAVCVTAINGKDALQKLNDGFKPELIFLDLNMPLMNGKQFLKKIKTVEELKDIPVIVLSTSSDAESILETKQLGARDFITKPDKFAIWETILKDALSA